MVVIILAGIGIIGGFIIGIGTLWFALYSLRRNLEPTKTEQDIEDIARVAKRLGQLLPSEDDAMTKLEPQVPLTKKDFERLLTKAAQPVKKRESAPEGSGTSESHPSDGYSGKGKSQDNPEGKEG